MFYAQSFIFQSQKKLIFYETYALSLCLALIGHNINYDLFITYVIAYITYIIYYTYMLFCNNSIFWAFKLKINVLNDFYYFLSFHVFRKLPLHNKIRKWQRYSYHQLHFQDK